MTPQSQPLTDRYVVELAVGPMFPLLLLLLWDSDSNADARLCHAAAGAHWLFHELFIGGLQLSSFPPLQSLSSDSFMSQSILPMRGL